MDTIAYAMVEAYKNYTNKRIAVDSLKDLYPEIPIMCLELMWDSIDAYVDINT